MTSTTVIMKFNLFSTTMLLLLLLLLIVEICNMHIIGRNEENNKAPISARLFCKGKGEMVKKKKKIIFF